MKLRIKVLLLLVSVSAFSQKNIDPTPEHIAQAKKIRETYAKDDVVLIESKENIMFGLDREGKKVTVNHKIHEVLMNINHRADIKKYEFYDSQSKIETFSLKYRNDKNANFYVQDELYKDRDLFYNDARVKHMDVDFPVQGYTYLFDLEKKYEDVKYFTTLYFNDEFPVLKKEINITVPDWLDLELKEFNFSGNAIVKQKVSDPKSNTTTYTFLLENIPAFYKEDNAPGRSYLYPHILVIAKSFKNKGKQTTLFNSSADLYQWYKSLIDQMKDNPEVLKEKVAELTATATNDEQKIKNIYYWVQDNIRYIAFEDGIAGFKPDESNNVFEKRYGDCKGMANLTKQMLKVAGFDARLTWIGTKHISYDYTTPSLAVDNHMICTLLHDGKKYFLDGTEKFNAFGEYAERIQNKEALIENGDGFIIEKIPAATAVFNKEKYTAKLFIENEALKGSCSRNYLGESRSEFLYTYNNLRNDKKETALEFYLEKNDKNLRVSGIKTSNLNNRDNELSIDYDIEVNNKVSAFDNDIYVDLEYMNEFKNFEFKDRKTDYEFGYKTDYQSAITLAIPDGYTVSKLPQDLTISNKDFDIMISFERHPKEIVYKKSFLFKNGVIRANEAAKWNDFVKNLKGVYNQQITLTKQI